MVRSNIPVECRRITLSFASYVVLPYFVILKIQLACIRLFPFKFRVVRTRRCILIRSRDNQSQLVVEKLVAIRKAQVCLSLFADLVPTRTCRGRYDAFVRRVFGY